MKKVAASHPDAWKVFYKKNEKKIKQILADSPKSPETDSPLPDKVTIKKTIKNKSKSIKKNGQGYWEVTFPDKLIMVYVPKGFFSMGSGKTAYVKRNPREGVIRTEGFTVNSNEIPQHDVDLEGFFISRFEISNEQFAIFLNDKSEKFSIEKAYAEYWILYNGSRLVRISFGLDSKIRYNPKKAHGKKFYVLDNFNSHPVTFITWKGAVEYCKWLSKKTGLPFRLPTEAEWEKAARGREKLIFPWGNHIAVFEGKYYANYSQKDEVLDGFVETSPVNAFGIGQSPFGIQNMAGNVSEWVLDWYQRDYYKMSPRKNPKRLTSATNVSGISRGGGWKADIFDLRTTRREKKFRNRAYHDVGFRILLEDK
jgi:formylglycine-generating enzyme required for sulfatase activity